MNRDICLIGLFETNLDGSDLCANKPCTGWVPLGLEHHHEKIQLLTGKVRKKRNRSQTCAKMFLEFLVEFGLIFVTFYEAIEIFRRDCGQLGWSNCEERCCDVCWASQGALVQPFAFPSNSENNFFTCSGKLLRAREFERENRFNLEHCGHKFLGFRLKL